MGGSQSEVGVQGESQSDKLVTHGAVLDPWQGPDLLQREEKQIGTDIENISSGFSSSQWTNIDQKQCIQVYSEQQLFIFVVAVVTVFLKQHLRSETYNTYDSRSPCESTHSHEATQKPFQRGILPLLASLLVHINSC